MSVKCPSCGFDSADGASWCDFCKEPFRPAQAPAAEKPSREAVANMVLPPDPEQVPSIPPWARLGAWIFLGLWVIFGCILAGVMMAKYEDHKTVAPVGPSEP